MIRFAVLSLLLWGCYAQTPRPAPGAPASPALDNRVNIDLKGLAQGLGSIQPGQTQSIQVNSIGEVPILIALPVAAPAGDSWSDVLAATATWTFRINGKVYVVTGDKIAAFAMGQRPVAPPIPTR